MVVRRSIRKKVRHGKRRISYRDAPLSPGVKTPFTLRDRQHYGLFVGRRLPEQKADTVNACNPYQRVNNSAA